MSTIVNIYATKHTKRLAYTCELLFKTVLGIDYQLVDTVDASVPTLNYSEQQIDNVLSITPHQLLFEEDIKPQDLEVTFANDIPYFFKTSTDLTLKYDVLAATFYTATRYEEYLPFQADEHGRFTAEESLAKQANFLHLPVVHLWADVVKKALLKIYPNLEFAQKSYAQINTIDVDVAYAFKGKPMYRQIGNFLNSCIRLDFNEVKNHWNYWTKNRDYLDTYDYIEQMTRQNPWESIVFFEIGAYAQYDRNIPLNKTYKSLINRLSKIAEIGIHPSYQSNDKPEQIPLLIKQLHTVINKLINKSRQHFLRLNFPATYERLIDNGITQDYSMGFADAVGFRAGMCTAYPFFNLKTNEQRPLTIMPFQVMDGTLKDYLNLNTNDANALVKSIKQQVQNVDGTFVSIFHNSSLTNQGEWSGWREVYKKTINSNS